METAKRVFSAFLVFSLTGVLTIFSFSQYLQTREREKQQENKKETTEVFQIKTKQDWVLFCDRVNRGEKTLNAVLDKDIDLKGEKIWVVDYEGIFDGQGNCIFHTCSPLFQLLGKEAEVKNLHIKNVQIMAREQTENIGGIAAQNKGSIRGCSVSGAIKGSYFVGGIAGFNEGGIEDCINFSMVVSDALGEPHLRWKDYTEELHGAGGITGFNGCPSLMEFRDGKKAYIQDCINYGDVIGKSLAGGICGHMEGYGRRYTGEPENYDISFCKNYGEILCETRYDEVKFGYVGGICGYDAGGTFYHCMNWGKVKFAEDTTNISKYGQVYEISPKAITNSDFLWDIGSRIIDCVARKGSVKEQMRKEYIMEVSEKELALWEEGRLKYVVNSWNFDLSEAIREGSLQPLGIEKKEVDYQEGNYYLSNEFVLALPAGFIVREEKQDGIVYGLKITYDGMGVSGQAAENQEIWKTYETWILRKDIDVQRVLSETYQQADYYKGIGSSRLISSIFIENLLGNISEDYIPRIHSAEDKVMEQASYGYNRIFFKKSLKSHDREKAEWEEYGNSVSLPLKINSENQVEAAFFLLHTDGVNCFYPPQDYVQTVNNSFYFIQEKDFVTIKEGDTVWNLAERKMEGELKLLLRLNPLPNPDLIFPGHKILLPDIKEWRARPKRVGDEWFDDDKITAMDTGRQRVTVYLDTKEIFLEELPDTFAAKEICYTMAEALRQDTMEETLKELHRSPLNPLTNSQKEEWRKKDTVTWYLKDFIENTHRRGMAEEVWYHWKEENRAYEQITVLDFAKRSDYTAYYLINMLERADGNYYFDEPWMAASFDREHYFIPSQGRYGQNDLWVPVRDLTGKIRGVAGYFSLDNQIIYIEKEREIRVFSQYVTRQYLPKEEQYLPFFMERAKARGWY